MKEKDLITDYPFHQVVLYAEKGDGSYGPFQTGSYAAGNFISEHFKITGNLNKLLIAQLRKGEISPVYFFMMIEGLSVPELAGRTGISRGFVKKHITPNGFRKMRISSLERYAEVFNVPVANMFQIISAIEDRNWDIGYQGEIDDSKSASISQTKTENPLIIDTKVIQNRK